LEAQAKAESKVERNFRLEAQLRAQLRGICNSRLEAQANAQLKGMCKFIFLNHRYHRHDHENISTSIEMLHLIVHTLKLSPTESMGVHNLINLLFLYRLNPCILDDLSKKAYIEIYMKSASAHILMPTSFAYNRKSIMLYLTSIFNIDSMMSTLNPCMLSDQTDILIRLVFGLYRNLRRIHPDIAEFDKNPLAEIYRIIHLILSDFYNLVYNYNRTIRFKGRYRFFSLKYLKYVFASSANPHARNPSVFDKINEVAMDVSQKKRVTRIFAIKLDYIYPNIAHVLFT
ncbi:uncharacterized protein NEMAJ01_2260, partial [Nematocida major]|uniref:uncharacterized protein n=1 Tax=Nematocida major TaxID=1912982 RepID=UPI0020077F64